MAIFNLGSINIDHIYYVKHLPLPGETLLATDLVTVLGGKGANQSIAAALAGSNVRHIGSFGRRDDWIIRSLSDVGIDTSNINAMQGPSGHAIIYVDATAENSIVLFGGANQQITEAQIDTALAEANEDDWFLLQNETNLGVYAVEMAASRGLKVCYSAAPFDRDLVRAILPFADLLIVNEIEERQIRAAGSELSQRLDQIAVVTTFGGKGARYASPNKEFCSPAYSVDAVDTTGAGDTFLGYLLAALDADEAIEIAMQRAMASAALKVSRSGTSRAIPGQAEVSEFIKARGSVDGVDAPIRRHRNVPM